MLRNSEIEEGSVLQCVAVCCSVLQCVAAELGVIGMEKENKQCSESQRVCGWERECERETLEQHVVCKCWHLLFLACARGREFVRECVSLRVCVCVFV